MTDMGLDEFHALKRLGDAIVSAGETAMRSNLRLALVTAVDYTTLPYQVVVTIDPTSPTPQAGIRVPFRAPYLPAPGDNVYIEEYPGRGMVAIGAVPDKWHVVGSVGEPAFSSSWQNFGVSDQVARFRRIGDTVYIEGQVSTGNSGASVFTLPVGYRPTARVTYFHWVTGNNANQSGARVQVSTSGTVIPSVGISGLSVTVTNPVNQVSIMGSFSVI